MIEKPPVLRLRRPDRRPTDAQIAAFSGAATSFVVDAMLGAGALDARIAPMPDTAARVAGPALTCDNGPGGVLATLGAIHLVRPGDVIVAGFGGHQGCAAAGDKVTGMARNAGAVAFITDGPVRDAADIRKAGLPVWCTGLTPGTPHENGPGTVGLPIHIAGQRVETGDLIVADEDGVVVVPFARIDAVIAHLNVVRGLEGDLDTKIADGFREPIAELLASDRVRWVK